MSVVKVICVKFLLVFMPNILNIGIFNEYFEYRF